MASKNESTIKTELVEPGEDHASMFFPPTPDRKRFTLLCTLPTFVPGNPFGEIDPTLEGLLLRDDKIAESVKLKRQLKSEDTPLDGILTTDQQGYYVTYAAPPWKRSLLFCKTHPDIPIAQPARHLLRSPGQLSAPLEVFQPEQSMADIDGDYWVMLERETKLNVSSDPRSWLRSLPSIGDDLYLGPVHIPHPCEQQFLCLTPDEGLCILIDGRHVGQPPALKYKIPEGEQLDGQILARRETVVEFSDENVRTGIAAFGCDPEGQYELSPKFKRDRLKRHVITPDGFIFELFADVCTPTEATRPLLCQIEIEFAGQLRDQTDTSSPDLDIVLMQKYHLQLTELVSRSLQASGLAPTETTLTKYQWITQ